jgi:DNA-binding transcriptional LysR family regulator
MHIYPFASRGYADIYGLPTSLEDVVKHRFVDQRGPQIDDDAASRMLNLPSVEGVIALRTNSSAAHVHAIELGIGIGALPTYMVAFAPELIPVDLGIRYQTDIWLTYHPDARTVRRVASFIDWLRALFDPKRYPCFGDEFIHPRDLLKHSSTASHGKASRRLPATMRPRKPHFSP